MSIFPIQNTVLQYGRAAGIRKLSFREIAVGGRGSLNSAPNSSIQRLNFQASQQESGQAGEVVHTRVDADVIVIVARTTQTSDLQRQLILLSQQHRTRLNRINSPRRYLVALVTMLASEFSI